MSSRHSRGDIEIDHDRWITFIDVDGRQGQAVELDPFILAMEPFWSALETSCVAGCCGLNAFDFFPENVHIACADIDCMDLMDSLISLRCFIRENPSKIFVSQRLNNYFDRVVILELIEHLRVHVRREIGDTAC